MEIRFSPTGNLVAANMNTERRRLGFGRFRRVAFCVL